LWITAAMVNMLSAGFPAHSTRDRRRPLPSQIFPQALKERMTNEAQCEAGIFTQKRSDVISAYVTDSLSRTNWFPLADEQNRTALPRRI
jgi:hypothetical protein